MAKKLDYEKVSAEIVRLIGGSGNVVSLSHCMTRLRFILKDEKKADDEAVKKIDGVLGVVFAGGQYMVILGQNLMPVYTAITKKYDFAGGESQEEKPAEKEKLTPKTALLAALAYVSASVTPMVPVLVAGGMLKVFLLLIGMALDGFTATTTYTILSGLADAPFFFMPIFVAYGAGVKLGGTPAYAMMAAAALLHGNWTSLVAAGEAVTLIGIPVRLVSYSTSLLPALLLALAAYYFEKLFNRLVPGIFKSLLVGLCTVVCTGIIGFLVLAPIGNFLGSYLANVFVFLGDTIGAVTIGILAACLPWLVMTGMHVPVSTFLSLTLVDPGYDSIFRPAFMLHNMCEGGACLGVALRARNAELRSQALGIAFGCIVAGVTEPAIYGISLPRRKPMIGVMAGGAVGGVVAGLLGVRAYVMGYSTILAVPIFQDTIVQALIAIAVGIATSCIVTYVLCPEISLEGVGSGAVPDDDTAAGGTGAEASVHGTINISSHMQGKTIGLSQVRDEVFSQGILGQGMAIIPEKGELYAPADGEITVIMDSYHAVAMTTDDGAEILMHIGMNTVELNGKGFEPRVKVGDRVRKGELLIRFDIKAIKAAGYDVTTPLVISNSDDYKISCIASGKVKPGDPLLRLEV